MNAFAKPEDVEIVKRGRAFKVARSRNESFWKQLEENRWEEATFCIFDNFIADDVVYVDVGSWIGPTVLYGAQVAKATYAFEPDPVAFEEIKVNLELNEAAVWAQSVRLFNRAVAGGPGRMVIGNRGDGGDSTTSALFADQHTSWEVEAITLDSLLRSERLFGERIFLKIDIEGGEFELLPAIRETLAREDVTLYLSIHSHFMATFLTAGEGLIAKTKRRLRVWQKHRELCRALPFKHLYTSDGCKLDLRRALVALLLTGRFPNEIVACKAPWERTVVVGLAAQKQPLATAQRPGVQAP